MGAVVLFFYSLSLLFRPVNHGEQIGMGMCSISPGDPRPQDRDDHRFLASRLGCFFLACLPWWLELGCQRYGHSNKVARWLGRRVQTL